MQRREAAVQQHHVHDVGRILLEVEAELGSLRSTLQGQAAAGSQVDDIIRKAEVELRHKAELILSSTVSADASPGRARQQSRPGAVISSGVSPSPRLRSPRGPRADTRIEGLLQQHNDKHGVGNDDDERPGNCKKPRKKEQKKNCRPRPRARPRLRPNALSAALEPRQAAMHAPTTLRAQVATVGDGSSFLPNVKFDAAPRANVMHKSGASDSDSDLLTKTTEGTKQVRLRSVPLNVEEAEGEGRVTAPRTHKGRGKGRGEEEPLGESVQRICDYEALLKSHGIAYFLVRNGRALTRSNEFSAFKRAHRPDWGPILEVLRGVEAVCQRYSVPIAYVDGKRLAALAADELSKKSQQELLLCVLNVDLVASLSQLPGRAYATGTPEAVAEAAGKVQATYRAHVQRGEYQEQRTARRAAVRVTSVFRVNAAQRALRRALVAKRAADAAAFEALRRELVAGWPSIKSGRRVEVHVPSLSVGEHLRLSVARLGVLQNLQMSRVCALLNADVDVVYVSPFALPAEVVQYYERLLGLRGIADAASSPRLKIVVPENAGRFPQHMALASTLLYSPKALRSIARFVRGRACPAYLVPGHIGEQDRQLALRLGLPLMGPAPDVAALLGSKSGAKQALAAAHVNAPLGAHDIFESGELYETLAKLVAANLDVSTWVIKVDDEFGGRGHATVAVKDVPAVLQVRSHRAKQAAKFAPDRSFWARPDVQGRVRAKLEKAFRESLAAKAKVWCAKAYADFPAFLAAFARVGGVIEAMPEPEDRVGSPSVSLFVEPSGDVRVVATFDRLFSGSNPFQGVGSSFPQRCVPAEALRGASLAVGHELHRRGVIGSVQVDFVAFEDRAAQALRLWAVDIDTRRTEAAASFSLFNFLVGGRFDASSGHYSVRAGAASHEATAEHRAFACMHAVHHPNLTSRSYQSFFHACRKHGASYDLEARRGLAFAMPDSLSSGVVAPLAVAASTAEAARDLHRGMHFVSKLAGVYVQRFTLDDPYDGTCTFTDGLHVAKTLAKTFA